MKVRHATLLNVFGRPVKYGGFTFMPADVDLAGMSFSPSFELASLPKSRIPPILRNPVAKGFDISWVWARMPSAFGFTPEPSEAEKTLLWAGFVAVADGSDEAFAFWCSDCYGKTSLTFSDEEWDEDAKANVADAFWSVLLSDPNTLEDFEADVRHLGAPITLHFGCDEGEPFYFEDNE